MPGNDPERPKTARNARKASHTHCDCVESLEADIKALKRALAIARGVAVPVLTKTAKDDDWMAGLASADRKWWERKLGIKSDRSKA